ncbi:MAG: hypothetical protein Q9168_006307 [Polycauliona sp. 1 TL-2023]
MCIHHLKYHAACGHTKQLTEELVYCNPVARAIVFYNEQPNEAQHHRGRFAYNPMKAPQPCGGNYINFLRNLPPSAIVGQNRTFLPEGWHPRMTGFVKMHLDRGEDFHSIVILTETEFPAMVDKISERWIQYLRVCFQNPEVDWVPPQDLDNGHFAGDIITSTIPRGCGRGLTGNLRCLEGWQNPYGGIAVCPFVWTQETGNPMPRRPDHEVWDLLSGANGPAPWKDWCEREMQLQARDGHKLYGLDIDASKIATVPLPRGLHSAPSLTNLPTSPPQTQAEGQGVTRTRGAGSNYCWPPASTPRQTQGHGKSASI